MIAYAIGLAGTFLFAGGQPTPGLDLVLQGLGWVALSNSVIAALAVGVGSVAHAR